MTNDATLSALEILTVLNTEQLNRIECLAKQILEQLPKTVSITASVSPAASGSSSPTESLQQFQKHMTDISDAAQTLAALAREKPKEVEKFIKSKAYAKDDTLTTLQHNATRIENGVRHCRYFELCKNLVEFRTTDTDQCGTCRKQKGKKKEEEKNNSETPPPSSSKRDETDITPLANVLLVPDPVVFLPDLKADEKDLSERVEKMSLAGSSNESFQVQHPIKKDFRLDSPPFRETRFAGPSDSSLPQYSHSPKIECGFINKKGVKCKSIVPAFGQVCTAHSDLCGQILINGTKCGNYRPKCQFHS
ncbi:hypothetical protein HK100_012803 [Physocladia obscura]|uniref:Uncharacterized protein n=1 Tax=Physocladia obscura TaxID=109957 RepID=A0AAD5SZ95_9FUNG|nr:hypothetical protein HK100_012803 [Physocladia obscura]